MSRHTDTTVQCDTCGATITAVESEAYELYDWMKEQGWDVINELDCCPDCIAQGQAETPVMQVSDPKVLDWLDPDGSLRAAGLMQGGAK